MLSTALAMEEILFGFTSKPTSSVIISVIPPTLLPITGFPQAKASIKSWYTYGLESDGKIISVYEEQLFKTEYEAKIALGNMF